MQYFSVTQHIHNQVPSLFWPSGFVLSGAVVVGLHSSPGAYSTPSDLEGSSFGIISLCLFIQFMLFLWQEYWSDLPFLLAVDHILSEPSPLTRPSWAALHAKAHSFIEFRKPLCHDKAVIHEGGFIWVPCNKFSFFFCLLLFELELRVINPLLLNVFTVTSEI